MELEKLFLDTSFAPALSNSRDVHHQAATDLFLQIAEKRLPMVTTEAVLIEIGDGLSRAGWRKIGIELLADLLSEPLLDIVTVTRPLFLRGYELYKSRMDKEWGLTDCISFEVMNEQGVAKALTTDQHFIQAGFTALLS